MHRQPPRLAGPLLLLLLSQGCVAGNVGELRKLGAAALCPFDVKPDRDERRLPVLITQLSCRPTKSMEPNVGGGGGGGAPPVTCERLGGTCRQLHTTLSVIYKPPPTAAAPTRRRRRSLRRHHNVHVDSGCVCVLTDGRPAIPVVPSIDR